MDELDEAVATRDRNSAWLTRAQAISPGGAQTLSKQRSRYGDGVPPALEYGRGAYVRDLNGRQYVDFVASLASVTLGHAHAPIVKAVCDQAKQGGTFALPHVLEPEVGEMFCAATGWDQVRWVSTGSEATEAAVRTARVATGRDRILSIGYHGWYTPWMAQKAVKPGVPAAFESVLTDVPYGDLDALARAFDGTPVAAVILEPTIAEPPPPGYLQGVVDLAHRHGALVIADEIITGFRWHVQGAMAGTFGVQPDLATYGKAISNGMFPIAALVGPRELMQHAWPVSGTYGGHPIGLAAVQAVLQCYGKTRCADDPSDPIADLWRIRRFDDHGDPIADLWRIGRSFARTVDALAREQGLPARIVAPTPHPVLRLHLGTPERDRLGMSLLVQALADRGVLWHGSGGGNVMTAHTPDVLAQTETAFEGAFAQLAEALADGDNGITTRLRGAPIQPAMAGRVG